MDNFNLNDITKETIYDRNSTDTIADTNNNTNPCKKLRLIHFNDVYNIEENKREPKAGAARFVKLVKKLKEDDSCLVFFR